MRFTRVQETVYRKHQSITERVKEGLGSFSIEQGFSRKFTRIVPDLLAFVIE